MNAGRAARLLALAAATLASVVSAVPAAHAEPLVVDRAVVRFVTRETGGVAAPRFVYERELSFEARLEALAEGQSDPGAPYRPRHVRSALERHVAETVLASLDVEPPLTAGEIQSRVELARVALAERAGGLGAVSEAARAEGIAETEVFRLVRRQALASLYLDRMVAPLLEPGESELRTVHRTERTPFSGRSFDEVEPGLRRWVVGARLETAIASFYEGLRTRLKITVLP